MTLLVQTMNTASFQPQDHESQPRDGGIRLTPEFLIFLLGSLDQQQRAEFIDSASSTRLTPKRNLSSTYLTMTKTSLYAG